MKLPPILPILLFAVTPLAARAETVISINIAGGNENAPGVGGAVGEGIVTGNAGIGQLGNWNNAIGTGGTIPDLLDSDGGATTTTFTWSTNNTWSTSTADGAGGDVDMMSGYLDNFNANGSIVIEGLGADFTENGYEILVYYQNDNNANTGGFTAVDSLTNTDTRFGHQLTANNNYPLAGGVDGYVISEETDSGTLFSANVVRLTGFRGANVTLTGVSGTGTPSTRSRPNAIQLISSPPSLDSDGDGLPDAWEIAHGLDPNDNGDVDPDNGAAGDPDGDGLSNLDEFDRGTDPQDADSDDDGLGDGVEDNTGVYVSPTQTGSNPLVADTDGDGLLDGEEVEENPFFSDPNNPDTDGDGLGDASEMAANPFVTNPSSEDTDGDGFSDSTEINLGSDPTDPDDVPKLDGGTVISVNIAGGNENAPGTGVPAPVGQGIVTGNAGIGQRGNWNNLIGTSGTIPVVNSDGNSSGATVTWTTNNTWSTSTADGAGTDVDMMSGYLDNFNANGSIVVEGLGTEYTENGYVVLVYYQNDNDANTAGFTATDDLANTDTRFGHQLTANNNYPLAGGVDGYVVSTETDSGTLFSANVVRLTGLSGADFTLTGVSGTGTPSTRARPNAIQIITEGVSVDSDGDGLPNAWEIQHGLDPNDNGDVDPANGADGDPDGDGLSNFEEFERGTDPRDEDTDDDNLSDAVEDNTGVYVSPSQTGSNPLKADTDGDGLLDGDEVEENPYFSDPNKTDTDGDGLSDASEVAANPFVTNPNSIDTDGDGFGDPLEIGLGSDPTDAASVPSVVSGGPTISVNIAGGNQNAPGAGGAVGEGIVTGNAGIGQRGNWNNAIGTDGTIPDLLNADGTGTGATFTWVTNNTWSTSTADGAGGDVDMMSGYLDNFHANGSIVVENLGPEYTAGYDVLVYYQNDNNANTAGFRAVDNLGNEDTRFGHQLTANNNWPLAGGIDGYVISVETEPNTLFSANVVRLTGLSGSEFTLTGLSGTGVPSTRARPNAVQVIGTAPARKLSLDVSGTDMLTFRWDSQLGKLYNLRSEIDPSAGDPKSWSIFDGHQDIVATPPENTLTIPRPAEPFRLFVVEEFPAPPVAVFSDDFESGQGAWTVGSDGAAGTEWELGTPSVVGPPAANSPDNCFGTNLAADYGLNANVWLRSPPIDLTTAGGATLNYAGWWDIEAGFDLGSIAVLDASDDVELAVIEPLIEGVSLGWEDLSLKLPEAALGKTIKVEFRLESDEIGNFPGLYVDDVEVTVP